MFDVACLRLEDHCYVARLTHVVSCCHGADRACDMVIFFLINHSAVSAELRSNRAVGVPDPNRDRRCGSRHPMDVKIETLNRVIGVLCGEPPTGGAVLRS